MCGVCDGLREAAGERSALQMSWAGLAWDGVGQDGRTVD